MVEEREPAESPVKPSEKKRRLCTDIPCFILFVISWFAIVLVLLFNKSTADVSALEYGRDYHGEICGSPKQLSVQNVTGCYVDGKNTCTQVYYPKVSEDVVVSETFSVSLDFFGICLPRCPREFDVLCTYEYTVENGLPNRVDLMQCYDALYRLTHLSMCQSCWVAPMNTTSILNRCIPLAKTSFKSSEVCRYPLSPTDPSVPGYIDPSSPQCLSKTTYTVSEVTTAAHTTLLTSLLMHSQVVIGRWLTDLYNSMFLILAICLFTVFVGFLFMILMVFFSKVTIWFILIGSLLLSLFVTLLFYDQADLINLSGIAEWLMTESSRWINWHNETMSDIPEEISLFIFGYTFSPDTWKWFAYIMTACTVILLFVVAAMGSLVNRAMMLTKRATKVIFQVPGLLTIPILPSILTIALTFFFGVSIAYSVASDFTFSDVTNHYLDKMGMSENPTSDISVICSDEQSLNCTLIGKQFTTSTELSTIVLFFNLLCYFWSVQFVYGVGVMMIARVVYRWYFASGKDKKSIGFGSIIQSMMVVVFFHLGSVAFGSFIIAVVQVVRSFVMWLDMKSTQTKSRNPIVKFLFKLCHCCLWCVEKCLKYISRNAYILVIAHKQNFAKSSVESFQLLASNIGIVSVTTALSSVYIFLSKVGMCVISGLLAFFFTTQFPLLLLRPILSTWPTVVVCIIITYATSSIIMSTFGITVDTIILCYCEENKRRLDMKKKEKAAEVPVSNGGKEPPVESAESIIPDDLICSDISIDVNESSDGDSSSAG